MPYTTKQHQALLECLSTRKDELLSAGELMQVLRRAGNPVGLATVYRQLTRLEQAGCVHRINTPEGAFYQYCDRAGDERDCILLRCKSCGRVVHLDCSHLRPLYEHLERDHHFVIDPRETIFSGLCASCAGRERGVL